MASRIEVESGVIEPLKCALESHLRRLHPKRAVHRAKGQAESVKARLAAWSPSRCWGATGRHVCECGVLHICIEEEEDTLPRKESI